MQPSDRAIKSVTYSVYSAATACSATSSHSDDRDPAAVSVGSNGVRASESLRTGPRCLSGLLSADWQIGDVTVTKIFEFETAGGSKGGSADDIASLSLPIVC